MKYFQTLRVLFSSDVALLLSQSPVDEQNGDTASPSAGLQTWSPLSYALLLLKVRRGLFTT